MTEDELENIPIGDIEKMTQYKDSLNYQMVLTRQMDRIARYRDINLKQYASSVDTLIVMLDPDEIYPMAIKKREQLGLRPGDYDGMNTMKMIRYDDLWVFINKQLKDHGMIFKMASGFERGSA